MLIFLEIKIISLTNADAEYKCDGSFALSAGNKGIVQ